MSKASLKHLQKGWRLIAVLLLVVSSVAVAKVKTVAAACTPPATNYGSVTLNFNVTTPGTYFIWSRILAPDTTNNSFTMDIDDVSCDNVIGDSPTIPANNWTWVNYRNGNTGGRFSYDFTTTGQHQIVLYGTEPSVGVDRIIMTTDGTPGNACNPPIGTGDTCVNGNNTTYLPEDMNQSGCVNFLDLSGLISVLNQSHSGPPDFTGPSGTPDGTVDWRDLSDLVGVLHQGVGGYVANCN